MRRVHNGAAYEELEAAVAKALVCEIRAVLQQVGLRGEELKSTVGSVASSVAAIYDGAAYVEGGEGYVVPILGFAVGRSRNQLLVPEEGGSGVHEFIPGALEEAFQESGA